YRDLLGHRGLTHSLLFALMAGLLTALIFSIKRWGNGHSIGILVLFFAVVTASHGFFDAMTNGGSGVAFVAPFENSRYFFPYRPMPVSPMTLDGLLTDRGIHVIQIELGMFWTFAFAVALWDRSRIKRMAVSSLFAALGVASWYVALNR